MERKMATVRIIDAVKEIPGADSICAYQVGGWWVVDGKESFKVISNKWLLKTGG